MTFTHVVPSSSSSSLPAAFARAAPLKRVAPLKIEIIRGISPQLRETLRGYRPPWPRLFRGGLSDATRPGRGVGEGIARPVQQQAERNWKSRQSRSAGEVHFFFTFFFFLTFVFIDNFLVSRFLVVEAPVDAVVVLYWRGWKPWEHTKAVYSEAYGPVFVCKMFSKYLLWYIWLAVLASMSIEHLQRSTAPVMW